MNRPRAVKSDELDTITSWRRVTCYLQRPGATARAKHRMHRRERHHVKTLLHRGDQP